MESNVLSGYTTTEWMRDSWTLDDIPKLEFVLFLDSGFVLVKDVKNAYAASDSLYTEEAPIDSNRDRIIAIAASSEANFGASSETASIGVEAAIQRSQEVIVNSVLEVERIMGLPASESNIYVYLWEGLSVAGIHAGIDGANRQGILLNGNAIAITPVVAHEVAHYYFGRREGPFWFYEGTAEYIGRLAQSNLDPLYSYVVGLDAANRLLKGALDNCERRGISPATIAEAESVKTQAGYNCQRYLGEYVIQRIAAHVGEDRILRSLREIHAQARNRGQEKPGGHTLTTKEILDILLDPQDPLNAGVRNELIAVSGATATHVAPARLWQEGDRQALDSLFEATEGQLWRINSKWLSDASISQWSRVEPDGEGRVVGLYLTYNRLRGKIPPELGTFAKLVSLDLSYNQLGGEIPPELGNLANLREFDLYGNQLSGEIPSELGNLVNLTRLDLGGNQLSGEIPPELGKLVKLTHLGLSQTQLSGEIPSELGKLVNLKYLFLDSAELSGCIPESLKDQLVHSEWYAGQFC